MAHSSSPKRWTHTHTNFCAILMHPNFAAQPEAAQRNRDKNKSRFKENKYIKKTFVWQHKTHNGMQVCYNRCKYKNTHTHITQLREYENTDEERKTKKAVQMAFPWQCSQWNCFTLANVWTWMRHSVGLKTRAKPIKKNRTTGDAPNCLHYGNSYQQSKAQFVQPLQARRPAVSTYSVANHRTYAKVTHGYHKNEKKLHTRNCCKQLGA